MPDIRIITKKKITIGKFRCNTCGTETDVYFIDEEPLTAIGCHCSGTSILTVKPEVVVEEVTGEKEQ